MLSYTLRDVALVYGIAYTVPCSLSIKIVSERKQAPAEAYGS
jgi:hypothetical protein